MNDKFCKFFKNGLVYNNDTTQFTASPCCYFDQSYTIDPSADIREQFANYKTTWLTADTDSLCRICHHQERSGIPSYRQAANNLIQEETDNLVMLTVAVNKKCNLACPSCGSHSSSLWYRENLRNHVEESQSIIQLHQEDHEHLVTERFLTLFKTQDLSNLRYIKFGGGEPFMNDTHLQILKMIPNADQVTVQYTSNFSIMPTSRVFAEWERFCLIKWVASIDGVGDQFEFLRWPYQWNKLADFKERAIALVPNNVIFGVEHTLNPLNIFYYDRFEQWFNDEFGVNRLGDPSDLNIHYANGIMGLDKTNSDVRNLVAKKYNNHSIHHLLKQVPYTNSTGFVEYLDKLDQWRSTSWRRLFPDVEHYYV
jgi:predicted 2-oxoglutarate/Fe(II)-dependent dioxygenase YbiX